MIRTIQSCLLVCLLSLYASGAAGDFSSTTIQIGMIVSDLDESIHFYKDIIGMVQVGQTAFDVDEDFGKRSGLTDSLPIHVEIMKLGAGEDATQLKLMTFGDRAKKQANDFIHSHTGIQYITIRVNNLAPILERIRNNNVPLLGETPIPLGEENHFVLVKDPDGTFVELIGPMEIKPPSPYQEMKEKSRFDHFRKNKPYKTESRKETEASTDSTAGKERKGIFKIFNIFGKRDNTEKKPDKAATKPAASKEKSESDSESKRIRNKFKKFNKSTPYRTQHREKGNSIIP